jgi:hypothetical protein
MALQDDAERELLARIAKLAHEATAGEVEQLANALASLRGPAPAPKPAAKQ